MDVFVNIVLINVKKFILELKLERKNLIKLFTEKL